jgi:signal peptidase I
LITPGNTNDKAAHELEDTQVPGIMAEIWDWTKSILVALLIVVAVHQFGFHFSTVRGSSMQPTLEEGEWLFINKAIRYVGSPQRGDVIILKEADSEHSVHPFLVKRVVGMPGDTVEVKMGKVYVNEEPISEIYTDSPVEGRGFPRTYVEEDHYFVMGDNRHKDASLDSRSFGTVPMSRVEGRAEWIVWPLAKLHRL